jgi:hypothetical protein
MRMMRSGRPIKEATVRETERVRRIHDQEAPRYDRNMGFFDRILLAGGREWACSQVLGEALELAVGTGRAICPTSRPFDGRGWVRTSDLSRVRRALSR